MIKMKEKGGRDKDEVTEGKENGVIMMRDEDCCHLGGLTPSARGKDEPSAYVLTPPIIQSRSRSGLLYLL